MAEWFRNWPPGNHSRRDLPGVIRSACREAGVTPADIDVFGATAGPGLVAALLVGNSTAKALRWQQARPFVSVNHLEGHLLSPFVKRPKGPVPHLGMVVSGGHTLFVDVRGVGTTACWPFSGRCRRRSVRQGRQNARTALSRRPGNRPHGRRGNPEAFSFRAR